MTSGSPFSAVFEFKMTGNTPNGNYGIVGPDLYNGTDTWFQIYQTAPDMTPANHLFLFYFDSGFNGHDVDLGPVDTNVGYHCAWTVSAANAAKFYLLREGFNPSSPSYVITPAQGTIASDVTQSSLWIQGTDGNWQTQTVELARSILLGAELSEAQVLALFRQRAPTAAVTAVAYNWLNGNDAATIEVDHGSAGQNWTKTGASFTGRAWQPIEWISANPILFGAEA